MLTLRLVRSIGVAFVVSSLLQVGNCKAQRQHEKPPSAWPRDIHQVVKSDTVNAILQDEVLRKTYFSFVRACADTSRSLTDQYDASAFSFIPDALENHL